MKVHLWLKVLLTVVAVVLIAFGGFIAYLSVTEYRPEARQAAEHISINNKNAVSAGGQMTIFSWNIGYAGLDASTDFFMDGGSNVNPTEDAVKDNLEAIRSFISSHSADAWLLQEVDISSARTSYINELEAISATFDGSYALAYNYKCNFVPIPLPPMGKMESGIATFTNSCVKGMPERISLPCPFSWPVSMANLKRCLLITRLEVEGSDKEVVLVNLHLEAYDDGKGKIAQTKLLMDLLQQEYENGNYVIAGGDFNQVFPGMLDIYPIKDNVWTPGILEESSLPDGFRYSFDNDSATCRLLDSPLSENSQFYALDGFIVSPNIQVDEVCAAELGFANSDHNPVRLQVTLLP